MWRTLKKIDDAASETKRGVLLAASANGKVTKKSTSYGKRKILKKLFVNSTFIFIMVNTTAFKILFENISYVPLHKVMHKRTYTSDISNTIR